MEPTISIARDLYAATNPAFGAVLLREATIGFAEYGPPATPFALAFLILPIVLSSEVAGTMLHTNADTGFQEWLSRHPGVLPGMPVRIRRTITYSRSALCFALKHCLLTMDMAQLVPQPRAIKTPRWRASEDRGRNLRDARRLGQWLGAAGEVTDIYRSLGIMP